MAIRNGENSGQELQPMSEVLARADSAPAPLLRHELGPFDVDKYLDGLKDSDSTEEEKRAFLQVLCLIMKTFVDIGWGVDSVQQVVPELADDLSTEFSLNSAASDARVETTQQFNETAAPQDGAS